MNKGLIASFFAACAIQTSLTLAEDFGPFKSAKDGSLKSPEMELSVVQFGESFKNSASQKDGGVQAEPGYPKMENGIWTLKGTFKTPSGSFALLETLKESGNGNYTLSISLEAAKPVFCAELALHLALPLEKFAGRDFSIDGREKSFPLEFKERILADIPAKAFATQCQDFKFTISGGTRILIQDNRAYKIPEYGIRIGFDPDKGWISKAKIAVSISATPYATHPLNISKIFNFGFKDDVAGDGKGGWTDQGGNNDIRTIKTGNVKLAGVDFEILDPAKNGGKSCLVFGGDKIPGLPKSAKTEIQDLKGKYLCVLNALAWPPTGKVKIGSISVNYSDGSYSSLPFIKGVDTDNWWCPAQLEKGIVAWTGENSASYIGLYLSVFQIEDKPLKSLEFISEGNSMWMIVAASLSDDAIPKTANVPFYAVANADWKSFEFPRLVEKGSVLDFSALGLLDAPAGKYGRVIAKDGHFSFEKAPAKIQRFYGTNIYFGICFPEKEQAEKIADMVASCGYNSVRFHHFDEYLASKDDHSRTTLDKDKMDKFHYFFKCLKERGVYITIDLFTCRKLSYGVGTPSSQEPKLAMLLNDEMMENLLQFSKNLLCGINPYTGLAWKDDPALAFVSCINEDPILWMKSKKLDTTTRRLLDDGFASWLKSRGLSEPSGETREKLMTEFITDAHDKAFAKMKRKLREMGVEAPLTDQNNENYATMALMRAKYDYVDNHAYWAHPSFLEQRWSLPMKFSGSSVLKSMAYVPSQLFPTRIFGKPFTVTEFNYCFPNQYRAEGGAVIGAYAALQDWDGLYRFGYIGNSGQLKGDGPTGVFDGVNNPMQLLSDRLGTLLFLRGDVKPSSLRIPVAVPENITELCGRPKYYSRLASDAGLVGQVGSVIGNAPDAVLNAGASAKAEDELAMLKKSCDFGKGSLDPEAKTARSSTGEIALDGTKGTFTISTPLTEVVVSTDDAKLSSGRMSADIKKGFASVSASSLDGKPLAQSRRILVLHLTNSFNTMTKFRNASMTILEKYGTLPHLARRGIADLTLKLAPGSTPKVYGVDLGGKRLGEAKSEFSTAGTLAFKADTFNFATPCFVYEIVRE